jgi:hypothetical protein
MRTTLSAAALAVACLFAPTVQAQTLTPLSHQPPTAVGLPFLLTDGTVLVQGSQLTDWYKLTPDASGSYVNGTWSQVASIPASWNYAPDAFASAVLADGRLLIEGGEYNQGQFVLTNLGAIYDPVHNTWTPLAPPPGWDNIGDSPSSVMPDGRFLIGRKLDQQMALLDPVTMQWTPMAASNKSDFNSEEGWTLMPDGTLLTVDVKNAPNSERYLPWMGAWLSDGSTVVDLHVPSSSGGISYPGGVYYPPGEVGPQILRPDGTVFATGAAKRLRNAHTSVYHPGPTPTDPGQWVPGPDFPHDDAGDSAASLLTNGHVLVLGTSGKLYEFDGSTLKAGPKAGAGGILLPLPNGQTLVTGRKVQVYTSSSGPQAAWAPTVSSVPGSLARGASYTVTGTQFNGLSQAAAYGDELETATNYPLVRITNKATGHVVYARTHDHSSMGVATGSLSVSTHFDVPANTETGASSLEVVANGIPSAAVNVTVQ